MSARRICIVGLDSYGMLSGEENPRYIGGEAIQHVLLARAWRDLGHDVSIIVHDEGQGQRRVHDGITAIAAQSRDGGIPGLRFFHPRATRLLSALIAADADTYYQSPAGAFTGITGWFCRATGRRFIFRIASDSDCEKEHGRIQFWRDRKLFNYGLRCANVIASQTELQAQMLRENHGLESTVVNMMVELPRRSAEDRKDIDVLWVSNLRALKRPELALELARQLPEVRFTLAGGPMPGGETYFEDVRAAAARLPNVTIQVVPAIAHAGLLGGFAVAGRAAYVETAVAGQVFEDAEIIAGLLTRFDTLRNEAFRGSESLALIERMCEEWTAPGARAPIRVTTAGNA